MKRFARTLISVGLLASFLYPISAEAVLSNPAADCSAGTTCTITFTSSADYYSWTVPSGVTTITFSLRGASGGQGCYRAFSRGGYGAVVTGTQAVSAGNILYVGVGSAGGDGYVGSPGTCSTSGTNASGAAGTNPFGSNGGGTDNAHTTAKGGGGGAASEIRLGGTSQANRIIVSAGGGGGGGNYGNGREYGGDASGNTGGAGYSNGSLGTGSTGKGGTTSAGGANGGGTSTNGSAGVGGNGNGGGGGGGGGYYGGGGSYYEGAGAGSSWVSNATSVTYSTYSTAAAGSVSLTYLNSPTPTTFSTSQSSPTNISISGTISYSLVLSQSVSDLIPADFQLGGTSTCNTPGLSGATNTYTVTLTNCSEGTVILQLKANSVTGTSTGPPTISSANSIVIDRTAPTISSVSAPANATYTPTNTPTFTVNFSESVTVTGTPRLTLTVGSLTKYATFLSMSDSKTASFRYTVGTSAGEFDTDGISVSTTLDLNGGSIADLATNALSPLTFTAPTLTSVLVAQPASAPTITSITATSTQLDVYFTAGASNGSAITNYQYSTNNGSTWTNRSPTATTSPISITGLVNGTAYTVRIRAINGAGTGDSSTAVIETPTAVSVTGDSTLVLTYGNTGTTSSYGATGGTGTYSWSLGSVISGVTLQGTAVQASASTPAGTYTQTVRATDGNLAVGTKTLTITVNKASTSISIALPNSATDAALGGATTITATVPRAGSVNFMLGGSTLSGCGSAAAASTTATCSWTPGALGSVSLTATFTPTDSSNYETATTTTLTITVVNGVSTVSLSLTGGVTQTPKGQAINIIAAINQSGKVSFFIDGKRIPKCFNLNATAGNKTCSWIPTVQRQVTITVTLDPTNAAYDNSSSALKVWVLRRSGLR